MASFSNNRIISFGLLGLLLVGGAWGLFRSSQSNRSHPQELQNYRKGASTPESQSANSKSEIQTDLSTDSEPFSLDQHFASLLHVTSPADARQLLEELRAGLKNLPAEQAAEIITRFIDGNQDADLPFEFSIGDGGFLETPPTFRVALLDYLGQFDPQAAAALGKQILSSPTTADEWAVSLRNVGRQQRDKETSAYLREKTEELIRNETWQEKPSVGYLNAFDVLVHSRATESTPLLSELIQRKDRRDLAHAGFLTLDRLTQRQPIEILRQLDNDRALQESRPEMVAQQFARADLRQPAQRELVQEWLLDASRTAQELHAFTGVFPNNNQMISKNLLTDEQQISGEDLLEHDLAALKIVIEWQRDPAFEIVSPHLATMAQRLHQFTTGAANQPVAPNP